MKYEYWFAGIRNIPDRTKIKLKEKFAAFGFTARTYHKVLKVARTIADLDGSQEILKQHLCEAIGYRTPDKKYWKR